MLCGVSVSGYASCDPTIASPYLMSGKLVTTLLNNHLIFNICFCHHIPHLPMVDSRFKPATRVNKAAHKNKIEQITYLRYLWLNQSNRTMNNLDA